jgi:hypothetical protein
MRNSIITKDMKIGEVKDILEIHGVAMPLYWEIAFAMLLSECESYLEVQGYYSSAVFVFH